MKRFDDDADDATSSMIGLDATARLVAEFYDRIQDGGPSGPILLDRQTLETRITWIQEELVELSEAIAIEDQVDALCDLLYFIVGTFVKMGIPPGEVFMAVHQANIRKVSGDYSIRKHPDGKVKKYNNWIGPENDIRDVLDRLARSEQ